MSENIELIKSNCPRDCYDGCGISIEKIDGCISRVLGDEAHPVSRGRLCNKCAIAYNGVWQDENERLLYPMKRTGDKGTGQFARISWDEAIAAITDRLQQDIANHGPESIIHTHYSGTLSLIALLFPMRFFLKLGASEVDPDSICNAAGHAALSLLYGESHVGFDPRTIRDSNCVLIWGANPSHLRAAQPQTLVCRVRREKDRGRSVTHKDGPGCGLSPAASSRYGRGPGVQPAARNAAGRPVR